MGAAGSRSSPPTETLLMSIEEYSKLMRAPVRNYHRDYIRFRDFLWYITVSSMRSNTGMSEPDYLSVEVFVGVQQSLESALGTDISIEILDHTGLRTVFQRESTIHRGCLLLTVPRRELEASSCIRRAADNFYVRCTLKEQRRPSLLGNWFLPKSKAFGKVDMAWCHTLTVDSLSEVKAALHSRECVYSTRFTVGGSRWYLKLCPALAAVYLVRATKEGDETRTTAEFSFTLEGAVNAHSDRMTHTFDRDSPDCAFAYQPADVEPGRRGVNEGAVNVQSEKMTPTFDRDSPDYCWFTYLPPEQEPRLSATSTDGLIVRCCVYVIPPVAPTAVPSPAAAIPSAVAISTTVPTPTDPELISLLSAMHG